MIHLICLIGDFKETMWQSEHLSASKRWKKNMENFCTVLVDCNMFDLGFRGPVWNYNNKQEGRKKMFWPSPDWTDHFRNALVLIPKGEDPQSLKDYQSINLHNVIYKFVSRCPVNRLRPILDEIISETQSAFIPDGLITNNATIAFECFHKIRHSRNPRDTNSAYKSDLAKA